MADPTKVCTKCEAAKPVTEYHKNAKNKDGLTYYCKSCVCITNKERYESDPDRKKKRAKWYRPEAARNDHLLRTFGLTAEQYNTMSKSQGGVCKICGCAETALYKGTVRNLAIDHCHDTGKVRGLLCQKCNTSIGRFNDDPELLQKAVDYLKEFE